MSSIKDYLSKKMTDDTKIDNFINWFGKSKVVNSDNTPKQLFNGTLSDFSSFDLYQTDPESKYGQGFYFSDNVSDVNFNYTKKEAGDMSSKIAKIKDAISQEIEEGNYPEGFDIDSTDDREIINIELERKIYEDFKIKHEGFIAPVYLRMENPMVIEKDFFERDYSYGEIQPLFDKIRNHNSYSPVIFLLEQLVQTEVGEIGNSVKLSLNKIIDEIKKNAESEGLEKEDKNNLIKMVKTFFSKYNNEVSVTYKEEGNFTEFQNHVMNFLNDHDLENEAFRFKAITDEMINENQGYISVKDLLRSNKGLNQLVMDEVIDYPSVFENSTTYFSHIFSIAIQKMGYDGIIMNPEIEFPEMDEVKNTLHYIVFKPEQIKSSIGNNGDYSLNDPNIVHRINNRYVEKQNVTKLDALKMINGIREAYPNLSKINIYEKPEDVPESVLQLTPDGDVGTSSGMFNSYEKRAFLFLYNIRDKKELEKTILHEVVGHMSMRELLNENYHEAMGKIYDYYDKIGELDDVKNVYVNMYNLDLNNHKHRSLIAEEKMAFVIEEKGFENFPLKNVIIGAIRNKLRKFLPDLEVTQNDVEYLVHSCHKFNQKSSLNELNYKKTPKDKLKI